MIRTRVGYTGGETKDPTYDRLGDHTESFQVDFDPKAITYEELLRVFWNEHDPHSRCFSTQYKPAIFYANEEQRKLAERTAAEIAMKKGDVRTEIVTLKTFYRAEDYHQKYYLRASTTLMDDYRRMFPSERAFVDSTSAARANGVFGRNGTKARFEKFVDRLGLGEASVKELRERAARLR